MYGKQAAAWQSMCQGRSPNGRAVDIACFDSSGETGSVPQRVFRISLTVSNISRHVCPILLCLKHLCQNCAKTPSIWSVGSCYLSESSFPKLLIIGTFVWS